MTTDARITALIDGLLEGHPERRVDPTSFGGERNYLRTLMNIQAPGSLPAEWLEVQDQLLHEENEARAITPPLDQRISIWQGDITRLRVDGIVNAANSALLGCFGPLHYCIDNAIHSAAGLQLRNECAEIMQGAHEPTGQARVTSAWNLPSKYVLHTVGPIVNGTLQPEHEELLAQSYRSVLMAALEHDMHSLALCCVSTGVFGFPAQRAAKIAVAEVRAFCASAPAPEHIIFSVFSDADREIYEELLR